MIISEDFEIWVRGRTLFKGYVKGKKCDPARDGKGWFHSGDLGHLDKQGYLTVYGRKDNMFISGGENIYPEEIERVLLESILISDAIVAPIENAAFGKRPVAFIKWREEEGKDRRFQDNKVHEHKTTGTGLPGKKKRQEGGSAGNREKALRVFLETRLPKFKVPDHFFGWPEGEDGMKVSRKKYTQLAEKILLQIQKK